MCKVKLQQNNKQNICKFFVVPGKGQTLLDMPDINSLNIINFNTIDTQKTDRANKCNTNVAICQNSGHGKHYTNTIQEATRAEKCFVNTNIFSKFKNNDKSIVIDKEPNKVNYLFPDPTQDNDKRMSVEIMQKLQRDFTDVFAGIGCFNGTFSLQVKLDSKLYQVSQRHVVYPLQKPFKEELEWLPQQDFITLLGVDETVEWCNSNCVATDTQWKSQIMPRSGKAKSSTHKTGPQRTHFNAILPKLNNAQYHSLIDVSSGYHKLKVDEGSSYITTFVYQFGRYIHKRLPFRAAPTEDMFQRKIDGIFRDLTNVFCIADDILAVGYDADGQDHDDTL